MNDGIVKVGLLGAFGVFLWLLVRRDFGEAGTPQAAPSPNQQLYNPVPILRPPTSGVVVAGPIAVGIAPTVSPTLRTNYQTSTQTATQLSAAYAVGLIPRSVALG